MGKTYFNNLRSLAIQYYSLLRKSNTKSMLQLPNNNLTDKIPQHIVKYLYPKILSSVPQEPLYFYAVIKSCFLSSKKTTNGISLELILHLLKWSWEVGEYEEVIKISDESNKTIKIHKENAYESCLIDKWKAKAMRNLGQHEKALSAYRDALIIARQFNINVEIASIILAIGKMYGKYARQENLYIFFINKSLNIFKSILKKTKNRKDITNNVKKGIAICYDELSKNYSRLGRYNDSLICLDRAIAINKIIKNKNGLSRNYCELALNKYAHDKNIKIDDIFNTFDLGYKLLLQDTLHIRGLGIRKIQLGKLLCDKGNQQGIYFVNDGIKIAEEFKDYRSMLRGISILAEITPYDGHLMDKLYEAASLANSLKLLDIEYDINTKLAKALIKTIKSPLIFPIDYVKLYDRNKEIMQEFSTNIINNKKVIQEIESKKNHSYPEFYNLSNIEFIKIHSDLVQDYETIIEKYISSYSSLMSAIKENELATQATNLLQMCSQVIQLFDHEIRNIKDFSKAKKFIKNMLNLFPDEVGVTKLSQCIGHVISHFKKDGIHVGFKKQTDISLPIPDGFLTFSIIQLINNGVEAYKKSFIDNDLGYNDIIKIKLYKEKSGDQYTANPSNNIVLSILNKAKSGDYMRLKKALSEPGLSDKCNRTERGMGIQYSLFIFKTICKAKYEVAEENGYTYLKFILKPDGIRIKEIE